MTQEENKELLFIDLCSRLPYHVRLKIWLKDGTTEEGFLDLEHNYADVLRDAFYYNKIKDIRPYLRPMSSMTEEESKEFAMLQTDFYSDGWLYPIAAVNMVNWLNKNHFDYRGLIEKGLAIEAPKGMYDIKEK